MINLVTMITFRVSVVGDILRERGRDFTIVQKMPLHLRKKLKMKLITFV